MDMTGIQSLDQMPLDEESVVFMRVDFNVPLDAERNVTDDARIVGALPSIKHVMATGAKLVLASHLGRPKGKPEPKYSMEPAGAKLAELLGIEVHIPDEFYGPEVEDGIEHLKRNQVILLENLRFHPGEEKGDPEFAAGLASLATHYVNDAFGTAHRKHASVYQMVQHFRRGRVACGFLIQKELECLGRLQDNPTRPFVAVMGGAKVSDKIEVLETLVDKVDTVLVGGAMAYTFLKAQGIAVGNSLVEDDQLDTARAILTRAKRQNKRVELPSDHRVAKGLDVKDPAQVSVEADAIGEGLVGLDIGPHTAARYGEIIATAGTVFWNGPMGVFEHPLFAEGTVSIAKSMAATKAFTVVGGGDSASAVKVAGVEDQIDHVSTGGGASMEFVEGKALPGIEALRTNHPFS